jgi:superfamily II DNA or RNA helicase
LLPAAKQNSSASTKEKAETIASLSWNDVPANVELAKMLGYDASVFYTPQEDDTAITYHQASSRFYELLDYQFVIKQRVLNELSKPYELKRMLVHMPTGTGKTKTMMHTLVHYFNFSMRNQGLVLWLAHTTELLQQAYDTFSAVWSHLGKDSVRAYKLWGTRTVVNTEGALDGVMFCGIQKLQAIKQNTPELYQRIIDDVQLIVFDEAHKIAARETKRVIDDLMIKKPDMSDRSLVGLTATPGRTTLTTSENDLLSNMFDKRVITIDVGVVNQVNYSTIEFLNHEQENNIIHYFQNKRILSKIRKEQLTYTEEFTDAELSQIRTAMTNNGYVDFNKKTLQMIGEKRSRNSAIMAKLRELSISHTPTILFACSVAHAKLLSFMLSLEDIPNGLVLGEMNPVDRAETIASFKDRSNEMNILINYEVLTTGFDATNIKCVFITRPTQSIVLYSQMIGRGLRGPMMGGNEECLLIDIKDNLGRFDAEMAFNHFDSYWK